MPILTPEQKAKQKAKLAEFHAAGKEGKAPTSANTFRPRKNKTLKLLADRVALMLPKSLDVIDDVLEGKPVDKTVAEMAKYIANKAETLTKTQMQEDADLLKYKVEYAKAQEANIIAKEDPQQVARELAAKGEHISKVNPLSHLEEVDYFPEEEEFFQKDAEEDEDD